MKSQKSRSQNPVKPVEHDQINNFVLSLLVCFLSVYVGALIFISNKINEIQPIPYLDEIYHVPQAQEYCKGNFSHVCIYFCW